MDVTLKEGFVSVADIAAYLGLSKMTIYRLVHTGEIESVRVGRTFRITEASADRYLKSCAFAAGNEGTA